MTLALSLMFYSAAAGYNNLIRFHIYQCLNHPAMSVIEKHGLLINCFRSEFLHCLNDMNRYTHKEVSLQGFCGFIDSNNIMLLQHVWTIKSKPTVWIHVTYFDFFFSYFPCTGESLGIIDNDSWQEFCGKRVPWQYYAHSSSFSIRYSSVPGILVNLFIKSWCLNNPIFNHR